METPAAAALMQSSGSDARLGLGQVRQDLRDDVPLVVDDAAEVLLSATLEGSVGFGQLDAGVVSRVEPVSGAGDRRDQPCPGVLGVLTPVP